MSYAIITKVPVEEQEQADNRVLQYPQIMEKEGELREALKAIKNVTDNTSWFRDTPYYWAEASLPLAYAVACVEVVSKSSEKASVLYNLFEAEIYYHCTNIGS